jgi:hypothetical protein
MIERLRPIHEKKGHATKYPGQTDLSKNLVAKGNHPAHFRICYFKRQFEITDGLGLTAPEWIMFLP